MSLNLNWLIFANKMQPKLSVMALHGDYTFPEYTSYSFLRDLYLTYIKYLVNQVIKSYWSYYAEVQ